MRKVWGPLTLLLLFAVPLFCHATTLPTNWGWDYTAQAIDPANATGLTKPYYTTWATTSEIQDNAYWGGSWYSIEDLGVRFNYDSTSKVVTSLDWVLLAGYNGVDDVPGSSDFTAVRNTTHNRYNGQYGMAGHPWVDFGTAAYRADPTIRLDPNGDGVWDWALVVTAPTGITDAQRQSEATDWSTASASLRSVSGDPWRQAYEWGNKTYDPAWDTTEHNPRYTELKLGSSGTTVASGGVTHGLAIDNRTVAGGWFTPNRWFWQGTINLTSVATEHPELVWEYGTDVVAKSGTATGALASYSMWCGNRLETTMGFGQNTGTDPVPEPTSMVLLAMALGAGIRTARRRKTPKA